MSYVVLTVRDPRELFELHDDLPTLDRPVLLHALTGFIDAGSAGRLMREHLLGTLEHRAVATFHVDELLDYRSRRPSMLFVEDHWESYDAPTLRLHAVQDAAGTGFLLLEGAEPDVLWERFIAAVQALVEQLGVRLTVGVHGIPMGVPHTRPVGVTAHGTRPELVAGGQSWVGTVQVPGSVINLLELRLGQAGHDAMGLAVHVPHYLSQAEYPAAAEALLQHVEGATGLSLPTAPLRAAAEQARADVDEQVAASDEVGAVVRALEQQYDAFVASRGADGLLAGRRGFPTADELAAELERYLAEQAPDNPRDS
jgi:predicted ATP-grasp superfamily ATP-dependent carboligase